ncbi:hypothetical protein CKO13_02560 [Halorhodospira neutriphila]|uniref:Integrase catalytic domain-containing protein n=1 Tax=Halorhodospira neutriphila TaxID=168379 RepID=A0ABS1E493_9GAMM|nr:polysaccharide biosynthesis tyrosine autokinase [Halorhodospira neutriphila]MBK1725917.1 hypothetical protein [Halorhodospira neutriphila]
MGIRLQKDRSAAPAHGVAVQGSGQPARQMDQELRGSGEAVRRWRERQAAEEGLHTASRLRTTLTSAQEAVVVALRRTLWLSLEDMLAVTREFLNEGASRSAIHRLLKRHGISRRPAELKPSSRAYGPGHLHIEVKYLPPMAEDGRGRYLFVAVDRATRWVHAELCADKSAAVARHFLRKLHKACPACIRTLLTDDGKELTGRVFSVRAQGASGRHEFERLCEALGIEHRCTQPPSPQANGTEEHFNGRISEVLTTHHFDSRASLEQTLKRYVYLYNHHLPQRSLGHQSPIQAMATWHSEHPELFHRVPQSNGGSDPRLRRIGGSLAEGGKLSESDLERVLQYQQEHRVRFGEAAIKMGLVAREEVDTVLARQFAYPRVEPGSGQVDPALEAAVAPWSERSERLRGLRAELMLRYFNEPRSRILPVVGLDEGAITSDLTANLAVVFAQLGTNTLLIDADLREPRLHELFSRPNRQGLSDALAGRGLAEPHRCEAFDSLGLLNGGTPAPNPQELLASERYRALSERVSHEYEVVLVNTPPLTRSTDAQLAAVNAGAALLVAQAGRTSFEQLRRAARRMEALGVTLVGATLCH